MQAIPHLQFIMNRDIETNIFTFTLCVSSFRILRERTKTRKQNKIKQASKVRKIFLPFLSYLCCLFVKIVHF